MSIYIIILKSWCFYIHWRISSFTKKNKYCVHWHCLAFENPDRGALNADAVGTLCKAAKELRKWQFQ